MNIPENLTIGFLAKEKKNEKRCSYTNLSKFSAKHPRESIFSEFAVKYLQFYFKNLH